MTTVIAGIVMFTAVVLALVGVLLAARRKLVASGAVTITLHDDWPRPAAGVQHGGCA